MSGVSAVRERVAARVAVRPKEPGGPWFVELRGAGGPTYLGPYENPALARDDARRITGFVLDVVREAADGRPGPTAG